MRKVIFVLAGIAAFTSLTPTPAASGWLTLGIKGVERGVETLRPPVKKSPTLVVPREPPTLVVPRESGALNVVAPIIGNDPAAGAKAGAGSLLLLPQPENRWSWTEDGTSHSSSSESSAGTEDAASPGTHGDKFGEAVEHAKHAAEAAHHAAEAAQKEQEQEQEQEQEKIDKELRR